MIVVKFGGTSVANAENISKVIEILTSKKSEDKVVVVVSAFGGVTDLLQRAGECANEKDESYIEVYEQLRSRHLEVIDELFEHAGKESVQVEVERQLAALYQILQGVYLINEFSNKTKDKVLSFGELLSSFIVSEALRKKKDAVVYKDSRELIITDSHFTHANVISDTTNSNISDYFERISAELILLPGFVSRNLNGETTTLGRGGSDYTAALIAAAIDAEVLEIWTDVSGMYTANPKLVEQAFPIPEISYQEAMELSHFGAKVLYPPTIQPILQKNIPICIKNTFEPLAAGTYITRVVNNDEGPVKGISHLENISLITLEGNGMVGIPGFSKRLFEALSQARINVILITQASSEHSICVGIQQRHANIARDVINEEFAYEISLDKIDPVVVENELAVVALIGDRMKSHQGISGKMFSTLGKNNVNIRAIAQGASERNITAVIAHRDIKKALNALHSRFFEQQITTLSLFIAGVGNVGSRLLEQIRQQQEFLLSNLRVKIHVVGISNSRKMVFAEEGVDLDDWQKALVHGSTKDFDTWTQRIKELNLRNSIFVDITANEQVAESYADYLKESIAVVACNKIACSSQYDTYKNLKELSRKYNAPFLFETNVGAGLPVIGTLNNLINSGDRVTSIQAVLSGSLNFIFNNFNPDRSFHEVVKQAQDEGYTEPDPRIDLSGVDVMRKILILARESGQHVELEEIENKSFLPKAALEASGADDFYKFLEKEAAHFESLYANATNKDCRLKYVATLREGKASVGLQEIPKDHPFYNLEGKDNIVLFYTTRYVDQPLIIKGAGAGADVTASGLFGDIITLARN